MEIDSKQETTQAANRLERQVCKLAKNLYQCRKATAFVGKKFGGDGTNPIVNKEAHMCLMKLIQMNYVQLIVTETKNGFFERANGGGMNTLIQLNGNSFKENCMTCNQIFRRDFSVEGEKNRVCDDPECMGNLGNNKRLGEKGRLLRYQQAQTQMETTDLVICIDMDFEDVHSLQMLLENNAEFIFINSEKTQYDDEAQFCIRTDSSKVLELLMKKLNFEPDEFRLKKYLKIEYDADTASYTVSSVDHSGYPFNYVNSIIVENERNNVYIQPKDQINSCTTLNIELKFEGYFNEKDLIVHVPKNLIKNKKEVTLKMENDLEKWISISPQIEDTTNDYVWDNEENEEEEYDFVTYENKLTETQIQEIKIIEAIVDKLDQEIIDKTDPKFDESDQVLIGSSTDDTSVN